MFYFQSLATFKKIMNIRLYLGHYHDPEYSEFVNNMFFSFCFAYSVSGFFIYFYFYPNPLDFIQHITYTYTMIQALFENVLSLLFRGNYLKSVYALIDKTENILNFTEFGISGSLYLSWFIWSLFRIYVVIDYSVFLKSDIRTWIIVFVSISSCVNYLSKVVIFDLIYHRMKATRIQFESKHMLRNKIGKASVEYRIKNIEKCLNVYHELVNFMKNIDAEVQLWVNVFIINNN